MKRDTSNDSMYSGTLCDLCKGPTLLFPSGSIWCAAEDPHPGGHFVVRVAFERSPNKPKANWPMLPPKSAPITSQAIKPRTSAPVQKPSEAKPGFGSGYDDFVRSDDK